MRLKKFLTGRITENFEGMSKEEILEKVYTDCKPFMTNMGIDFIKFVSNGILEKTLYRGMDLNYDIETVAKYEIKERDSRATHDEFFPALNKWLVNNHFVPRNKAAFVTSDIERADYHAEPYIFLPIGNYQFTYCKSNDFNIYEPSEKGFDKLALVWEICRTIIPDDNQLLEIDGTDFSYNQIKNNMSPVDKNSRPIYVYGFTYSNWSNIFHEDTFNNWEKRASKVKSAFSNRNLLKAMTESWEIWFWAPKGYYLINPDWL